MPSETRKQLNKLLTKWSMYIKRKPNVKILDVGIAGDKVKPSDRYCFFEGTNFKTLDIDKQWKPDYVQNIIDTNFKDNTWDMVIVVQCLEHIWMTDLVFIECQRILKKGGYLIIDSPLDYPYHDPPDYYRFTTEALKKYANRIGLEIADQYQSEELSAIICQKK